MRNTEKICFLLDMRVQRILDSKNKTAAKGKKDHQPATYFGRVVASILKMVTEAGSFGMTPGEITRARVGFSTHARDEAVRHLLNEGRIVSRKMERRANRETLQKVDVLFHPKYDPRALDRRLS